MVRRPTRRGPVSFRCRLYFRETFPLLNDGAKSKVRSLFVVGNGSVSFRCRLYFRETFPLLNDGAKSKVRSLFVSGSGPGRNRGKFHSANNLPDYCWCDTGNRSRHFSGQVGAGSYDWIDYCVPIFTLVLFPWHCITVARAFLYVMQVLLGFSFAFHTCCWAKLIRLLQTGITGP